jgi:hypothetical protein
MPRIHLFEFEDLTWFPQIFRNYLTDFLQFVSNKFDIYQPAVPIIEKGLEKSGTNRIIDIASGGGGGWLSLSKHLLRENKDLKIILTDYFPNISAFEETVKTAGKNFEFITESVDACNVPKNLVGLRTQFLSFHHFQPEKARSILQNAVDSRMPIAIFEAQERSFVCFIAMLISPLNVLISTPLIRPFRFSRLIFTFLIPVVPLIVLWDGIVSMLRTYSVEEMNQLIAKVENSDSFNWEVNRITNRGLPLLYLLGYPKI